MGAYGNKNTCVHPVSACVGVQCVTKFCIQNAILLFDCVTRVQRGIGVTVVNKMCHGEVVYKKVWWSSSAEGAER